MTEVNIISFTQNGIPPVIFMVTGGWAFLDGSYRLIWGTGPLDQEMLRIDIATLIVSTMGLCLVALFNGGIWWRRYQATRKIKPIPPLLEKGRHLLNALPETTQTWEWVYSVEQWTEETVSALYLISPTVCSAFTITKDVNSAESYIRPKNGISKRLEGETRETYQRLQIRLENLRQIVTKPEEYL